MVPILSVLAVLATLAGLLTLTRATAGVGLIAFGCFLLIAARLRQASAAARVPTASRLPQSSDPAPIG